MPQGITNHGDPKLLCGPSTWTDIAIFTLANYIAHAATVRTKPDESALHVFTAMVFALLIPTSGVVRGIRSICQAAILAKTDIEAAKKAHALCVVVRTTGWQPHSKHNGRILSERTLDRYVRDPTVEAKPVRSENEPSGKVDSTDEAFEMIPGICKGSNDPIIKRVRLRHHSLDANFLFYPSSKWNTTGDYQIHGTCVLPPGYALCTISSTVVVQEIRDVRYQAQSPRPVGTYSHARATGISDHHQSLLQLSEQNRKPPTIALSSNLNILKTLIAIFQFIYASVTLYKTKGDQIEKYGFAAFGLTVVPYLIMSLVNLIGSVLTPDYPKVLLVHSEIVDEAMQCAGARFEGMVGTIERPTNSPDASEDSTKEAAEDSVTVAHVTNGATNHSFEAALEIDDAGRILLLRGDNCPAEWVVFDTSEKISSSKETDSLTFEIAAGSEYVAKRSNQGPKALDWGAFFVGCLALLIVGTMHDAFQARRQLPCSTSVDDDVVS